MQCRFRKRQESGHVQNADRYVKGGGAVEASQIVCMGILIVISVIDLRNRRIPAGILAAAGTGAFLCQCLCRREDVMLVIGGMGVGALFLFISRVTREGIGYGDSLGILGLGIYLGLWKLLEVLAGAFVLLALCGIVVLIRKKMSRKSVLPFYPFLALSYVICLIVERGI